MIINIRRSGAVGYALIVSTLVGADITVTKGDRTYTATTDSSGEAIFKRLTKGIWTVTATKDGITSTTTVDMQEDKFITIILSSVPEFSYSISAENGGYAVYDDNDNDITDSFDTHQGNWKIKFFKSGELTISSLNGMAAGIDVFCVGGGGAGHNGPVATNEGSMDSQGGGGGGGGGYTTTKKGVSVQTGKYTMSVGGSGGTTYAFKGANIEVSAKNGGNGSYNGGNGGSGGGCGTWTTNNDCYGGTNGGNGRGAGNPSAWSAAYYGNGGKGQGTTTKEFGESSGKLYASGGQGAGRGTVAPSRSVTANTGNGGAGGLGYAAATTEQQKGISGASGIIIIRNKR